MQFTQTQQMRLTELGVSAEQINEDFDTVQERERAYQQMEKQAVRQNREMLLRLVQTEHMPKLIRLRRSLEDALCEAGFCEVTTPLMIPKTFLDRMTIDGTHPLHEQVYWIDRKTCLRPMLAPNLYDVSRSLLKVSDRPLRIFEIGSCFRKESEGRSHLKEFTMLNLVEWGTPLDEREDRLREFAELVMKAADITDFGYEQEESVVYGKGLDVVAPDGTELGSSSMGPHPLDDAWKMTDSWVGIGFGLERLLMHRERSSGIHRYSKSIAYLDGARLNIK
ncbi:MAG: pyrrolysine--tRNA(Pyl) ligase large subunit [Butyricicoccus sp.]